MKVVYSACYGGFGLSEAAIRRYAEIKGVKLYEEVRGSHRTFWTCPPEARGVVLTDAAFYAADFEARRASNEFCGANQITPRDFVRHDPILVQVVEELGTEANGEYADLEIAELPDGSKYQIDEYDGNESVETPDSYEWIEP